MTYIVLNINKLYKTLNINKKFFLFKSYNYKFENK